jgi:two-component system, NtrC family, sensor histidine kinase HydH
MTATTTVHEQAGLIPEITSIVHDMRSPLSAIYGSAELLIGWRLSEPQLHRIARNMYGASVRMKELLDELLSRYRGTHKQLESCDLRELVTSAVDKIALLADAQAVEVVQRVPENLLITVDRQRIQRVLVNLFVNALDVMPNGGAIRISATAVRDSVLIKVRDTGPGIAPEIRGRLFQPFATAGKAGGLGLGLTVSRQAVIDHGGRMWAESLRQGACFAVRLPTLPRRCSVQCCGSFPKNAPHGRCRQQ